ncbi:MAG: hypothetical protein JO257_29485 [Deltaproteobacteria bacterium]|nr:hypothetical protein [Deltaproteobacteria bacterium]
MRVLAGIIVATHVLSACTASGPDKAPVLTVTSPSRGTFADGTSVTVTGTVVDDGPVSVTVAGQAASVGKDGTFSATVALPPGISIIETHAVDKGGHDVRDVRAVLAGTTAMTDGTTAAPIGARAGTDALTAIGTSVAHAAEGIDFTAVAQQMNPVYDNGGCLGAKINITSVDLGAIDVALTPGTDKLSAAVDIANVVVKLHADFKVACIGGSTTITVTSSKAHIKGDLTAGVAGGHIATALPNASVTLDNFNVDVGGVPGAIESLLDGQARTAAQNALTKAIKDKLPGLANNALAGLVAKPVSADILGHAMTASLTPTQVSLTTGGIFVGVSTKLVVAGGEGGTYLAQPAALAPTMLEGTKGFGIALADDLVDQLLGGLWAAGAFDKQLPIGSVGILGTLLDPDAATLDIKLSLPPTVTPAGADLSLAIGDAIITVQDANGATLQQIALSIKTTLAAGPTQSGKLTLTLGQPEIHAMVVEQADSVSRPLSDAQIEGIVNSAWGVVSDQAGTALAKLPMPTIAGVTLGTPTVKGADAFVAADVPVN